MSAITVTLPDGSTRSVPAGAPVRDVAAEISPNLAKAALAAIVDGKLVDLAHPLKKDATVRIVTDRSPEALPLYRHSTAHLLAAAVTNLFPGRAVRHRSRDRRRLLLRLRRAAPVRARGSRSHREQDERDGGGGSGVRAPDVAARGSEGVLRHARRAAEGAADRREDRRPAGGLLLHDQGQGHLHRFLRRPARPVDRPPQGVQAAQHVERVLEGRRAQPADAARLRHRVLLRQGSEGAPHADRGGEEARPPQARTRARAVHVSSRGRRARPSGCERARRCTTRSRTTCAAC